MKTLKNLNEILQETFKGSFLFTKYPELVNGKDIGEKKFSFVEGGYDNQTIIAETMRFYAVASIVGAGFLIPKQAPLEQIENLIKELDIAPCKTLHYDNSNPLSYLSVIETLPEASLHVLHSYANISSDKYAVYPDTIFWLNNKVNLPKISAFAPKMKDMHEPILPSSLPFVIKKFTGSSGDGVKIVKSLEDLSSIPAFIQGQQFFIQEFIESKENYGIQFLIDIKGDIHLIGFGNQNTSETGEFQGICCNLDKNPPSALFDIAIEAAENVANKGYYGFLGFDILKDYRGKYWVIDPNIRLTAATPVYLLKDKIKPLLGASVYIGSSKAKAESPTELISQVKQGGGLLLSMSDKNSEGFYKFFAMFGGKTSKEALVNWNRFIG